MEEKVNKIKDEQNKVGNEIMNSIINNNNYEEEKLKLENKLNRFLDEQNEKFNNNTICFNYISSSSSPWLSCNKYLLLI